MLLLDGLISDKSQPHNTVPVLIKDRPKSIHYIDVSISEGIIVRICSSILCL